MTNPIQKEEIIYPPYTKLLKSNSEVRNGIRKNLYFSSNEMAMENGWSCYFRVLRSYGILPISLSKERKVVSTKANRKFYHITFTVIQTVIILLFVYGKLKYWSTPLGDYGSTGNNFAFIEEILSGVVHIILHPWMFFLMEESLKLVQNLLECDRRTHHLAFEEKNYTLRNFIIAASCLVFFDINCLIFCSSYHNFQVDFFFQTRTIIMFENAVNFTHAAIIMSFYTSLVSKVRSILGRVNRRFEEISRQLKFVSCSEHQALTFNNEMMTLFKIRNEVLVMCSCDISSIYGFAMLLISGLMLLDMTHVPYYIVYRLEQVASSSWSNLIYSAQTSIAYITPKLVVFVLSFTCNTIGVEVSFYV